MIIFKTLWNVMKTIRFHSMLVVVLYAIAFLFVLYVVKDYTFDDFSLQKQLETH